MLDSLRLYSFVSIPVYGLEMHGQDAPQGTIIQICAIKQLEKHEHATIDRV